MSSSLAAGQLQLLPIDVVDYEGAWLDTTVTIEGGQSVGHRVVRRAHDGSASAARSAPRTLWRSIANSATCAQRPEYMALCPVPSGCDTK